MVVELLLSYSNLLTEAAALAELLHVPSGGSDQYVSVASPPRMLGKRPSRSVIPRMIMDYQAGLSSRELATKYDSSKTVVLRILKAEGVTRPRGKTPK